MHELSIAQSIVELVEKEARRNGSDTVLEVELEIGTLAGIELQTLDFALGSAVKNTMLEHARIVKQYIQGVGHCSDCEASFAVTTLLSPCLHCGSYCVRIVKGKELRVKSIVV